MLCNYSKSNHYYFIEPFCEITLEITKNYDICGHFVRWSYLNFFVSLSIYFSPMFENRTSALRGQEIIYLLSMLIMLLNFTLSILELTLIIGHSKLNPCSFLFYFGRCHSPWPIKIMTTFPKKRVEVQCCDWHLTHASFAIVLRT